jgi:hypothetical protein
MSEALAGLATRVRIRVDVPGLRRDGDVSFPVHTVDASGYLSDVESVRHVLEIHVSHVQMCKKDAFTVSW